MTPEAKDELLRIECLRLAVKYCEARLVAGEAVTKTTPPLPVAQTFYDFASAQRALQQKAKA